MRRSGLKIPRVQLDWSQLNLASFESRRLKNGANLFQIQSLKRGLCSFEMVFRNGRISEHKKLSSRMAANQIQEGTANLTSNQVADTIDYYGANFSIHADLDFTVISMSCLQKHFTFLCDYLLQLVSRPAYREEDLQRAKLFFNSQLQHQLVEPDYVSYREFTSLVYGIDSVYGYNTTTELIEALQREDLIRYHKENYVSDVLEVFYCGEINPEIDAFLDTVLQQFKRSERTELPVYTVHPETIRKKHIAIEHCAQSSLKLGLRCIPKMHPDFFGLYILNAILGDYFGSRLMKNLREDKGYTYDIHSTLDAQVHDGCFYVSAELNSDHLENAVYQIKDELNRLRTELIPVEELDLVKNYICGNIMRLMDGPFQTMTFIKILVTEYGRTDAFTDLLSSVLEADPEHLRSLANANWLPENMIEVTAGAG